MTKKVNLLSYLPEFVQQYDEFQKVTDAENPEFELLWERSGDICNQLFITTATEQGLRRYEKMLGIIPFNEDLEIRRTQILFRINDQPPYTMRALMNLLDSICGKEKYSIDLDTKKYTLKIWLNQSVSNTANDVAEILKRMCPANIFYIIAYDSERTAEVIYSGAVLQSTTHYTSSSVDLSQNLDRSSTCKLHIPGNCIITEHTKQNTTISI